MQKLNSRRAHRRTNVDIQALQRVVERSADPQGDNQRMLTDGPYIETKELIAG